MLVQQKYTHRFLCFLVQNENIKWKASDAFQSDYIQLRKKTTTISCLSLDSHFEEAYLEIPVMDRDLMELKSVGLGTRNNLPFLRKEEGGRHQSFQSSLLRDASGKQSNV